MTWVTFLEIIWNEKFFLFESYCCRKVGWVSKIWGEVFLVVPPKDKLSHLQNKQVKKNKNGK
jgi:hypothetical protein